MDKFVTSTWFVRGASLVIALLLFISVNFEIKSNKTAISTSPEIDTVTIQNVPVEVYYDTENLVISGIPDHVDVTLKGAKSLLTAAKNQRDFKVYADLSDPNITLGKRNVAFKISDLNEKLVARINPESVEATVQEKVTKEFPVDAEYNHSVLEDGYIAEQPTVNPQTVKITGAKETVEQIAYVKALLSLDKGVNESVSGEATVRALDKDLNKLDVTIEPANVNVALNVSIPKKKVKVNPVQTGKVKDGLKIKSISIQPKEVTLYGKQEELDKINEMNINVDVTNVTGDTEMELNLPQLDHIKNMSTSTVKVKIKTGKVDTKAPTSSKEIKNLSIGVTGVADNQNVEIDPKTTSITLIGDSKDLKKITLKDIEVSVDVSQLTEGQHDIQVTVKAPTTVEWKLSSPTATVSITQKAAT